VRNTDLYCEVGLAPWEAVLGATVQIQTLDGTASLKIPAGTQADQSFRLRGQGLPVKDGPRGDLYVTVSIQVPSHLTPEEHAGWEQLSTTSTFNPRKSP
jgi:curved DNA-binding protein